MGCSSQQYVEFTYTVFLLLLLLLLLYWASLNNYLQICFWLAVDVYHNIPVSPSFTDISVHDRLDNAAASHGVPELESTTPPVSSVFMHTDPPLATMYPRRTA